MTNDIKVLNGLVAISPDITIWSGKRKMQAEDFGINKNELPPAEISDLGAKKLCPPERMRIFLALKARCVTLLDRHGIKFIASSWLVPKDKVKDITEELERIKLEFQQEKATFLADYASIIKEWIARHPQWETMLANSVPSVDYVSSKLLFGWKSFRFSIAKDSNIAEDVAKLADSVFADIARQAAEAYRDVFADRTQLTQRSLGPLRVMETKLSGLQFIEPRVAQAAQLIRTALDEAPDKGPIQGADLSRLLGLVCLLRDAEAVEDYTTRMMDGQSASGLLAGLAAPVAVSESVPAMPIGVTMRQSAVIASQGLW